MKESLSRIHTKSRAKDLKLNSLLEVTKAINSNYSTEQLFAIYKQILQDQLKIGKVALYSFDKTWNLMLSYGLNTDKLEINVENDLLPIKEISEITTSPNSHLNIFDSVIPVFHKAFPLAYVLIGDLAEDKLEISPTIKHLPFIQTLTNIIVVAIENKKLAKDNIRQEGVRRELELASEMQSMLFPETLPDNDQLQIAAYYQPHHEVGGDYYDYIKLNENEIIFCMADVSGKGVSAALLMSNFQANLRALVNHTSSLHEIVKELNAKVMTNAKGEKFITLFIAKYNLVTKVLSYINAGHNPPLLITDSTVSMLKVGCTGLGMFEEIPKIQEGIVNITSTSVLMCYTDGLVEQENDKGEDFGMTNLVKILEENSTKISMPALNSLIIDKVANFRESQAYVDDIALLSCKLY